MTEIFQQEWRDETVVCKYPFTDSSYLMNSGGDVIPDGLFIDLVLFPVGATANMYLYSVVVATPIITIKIADSNSIVCTAELDTSTQYTSINFKDTEGRPAGYAVCSVDGANALKGWTAGEHLFTVEQAEFCATVCIPTPEIGVRSFKLPDGVSFFSDVVMVAENGVSFEVDLDGHIHVNAIGEPFFKRVACENAGTAIDDGPFLKTITVNGVVMTPDSSGIFRLDVGALSIEDTLLRAKREGNSIRLSIVNTNN